MKPICISVMLAIASSACTKGTETLDRKPDPQAAVRQAQISPPPTKGTEQGNGADYFNDADGSAWFLGEKNIIKVCYVVSDDFGLPEYKIKEDLTLAFLKWHNYIKNKHINHASNPKSNLAIKGHIMDSCDGTEDVKFYFGVHDKTVDQNISKNNIALSKRLEYDSYKGWGKGFVWVTPSGSLDPHVPYPTTEQANFPNWKWSYNLLGILTHEIGHIYGCGHIDNTIMDENIYSRLGELHDEIRAVELGRIDSWQELYICYECDINAKGFLGHYSTNTDAQGTVVDDGVSEVFEFLTGRKPLGGPKAVKAQLIGNFESGLKLLIWDNKDNFEFVLGLNNLGLASRYTSNLNLFRTTLEQDGTNSHTVSRGGTVHVAFSVSGTITSQLGKTTQITVERNMNPSPWRSALVIRYLINGETKSLFAADSNEMGE